MRAESRTQYVNYGLISWTSCTDCVTLGMFPFPMHDRPISTMTSVSCCGCYVARCKSASDGQVSVLVKSSEESERSGSRSIRTAVPSARGERTQGFGKLAAFAVWFTQFILSLCLLPRGPPNPHFSLQGVQQFSVLCFLRRFNPLELYLNFFLYIIVQGHHRSFVYDSLFIESIPLTIHRS